MPHFVLSSPMPVPVEALATWHERPGALERLTPPWEPTTIEGRVGTIYEGRVTLRMPVGPFTVRWVAEHRDGVPGRSFFDHQLAGPFRTFAHHHRFEGDGATSRMVDDVTWEPPRGTPPPIPALLDRRIARAFRFRHARLAEDLRRLDGVRPRRVIVTGASGLVGEQLVAFLGAGGHRVERLVRRPAGPGEIAWDPARGVVDAEALEGADAVIHLAGATIAQRWTPSAKTAIRESRVAGTTALARALAGLRRKPEVFVSASAVGWYGDRRGEAQSEEAPAASGFLADVCRDWEAAAAPAAAAGIRTVHPRLGVVLSPRGGALAQLLPVARAGLSGPIGTGRQPFPWIDLDDLVYLLAWCLDAPVEGPVNAVAPESVDQATFARTLGAVLRRPAFLPLPAFAVRLLFGQMGVETLLQGAPVVPARARGAGFRFHAPTLEASLRHQLGR